MMEPGKMPRLTVVITPIKTTKRVNGVSEILNSASGSFMYMNMMTFR